MAKRHKIVYPTPAEQKIIDRRLAANRKRRLAARRVPKITTTRTRFVERGLKKAGLSKAEIKKLRDK